MKALNTPEQAQTGWTPKAPAGAFYQCVTWKPMLGPEPTLPGQRS